MHYEVKTDKRIYCCRCKCELKPGKAEIAYLGTKFPVILLKCPECGDVFIEADLANGKIAEVERALEGK